MEDQSVYYSGVRGLDLYRVSSEAWEHWTFDQTDGTPRYEFHSNYLKGDYPFQNCHEYMSYVLKRQTTTDGKGRRSIERINEDKFDKLFSFYTKLCRKQDAARIEILSCTGWKYETLLEKWDKVLSKERQLLNFPLGKNDDYSDFAHGLSEIVSEYVEKHGEDVLRKKADISKHTLKKILNRRYNGRVKEMLRILGVCGENE